MNGLEPIREVKPRDDSVQWPRPAPASTEEAEGLIRPGGWLQFEEGQLDQVQVIRNLELAVSLLQTASKGLGEIDEVISDLASVLSAYWGRREQYVAPPEEMHRHLAHKIDALNEIVRLCRFHGRGLLDGQSGVTGYGQGVTFVRGGTNTASSPPEGYEVAMTSRPTRTAIVGGVPVHENWIGDEREIFLAEGERYVRYTPESRESVAEFLSNLQRALFSSGLDLEVGLTRQRLLVVRHTHYGSQYKFKGSSMTTPLLSKRPGKLEWSRKGRDIQGTIAGEPAFGIGRMLVGYLDNPRTSELSVCWKRVGTGGETRSRCHVVQNGIVFKEGNDPQGASTRLSLPSFHPDHLGRWVDTRTGFGALASLRVETWQEVLDSLYMLLSVSGEVEEWKARLKAWIERYQNRALVHLRQGILPDFTLDAGPEEVHATESMASVLRRYIHAAEPVAE